MNKSLTLIAFECFFDLGVTVVYAVIAGLLIVGIVASDDGAPSIVTSLLYASILPAAVLLLIAIDLSLRVIAERRAARKETARPSKPGRDTTRWATTRA